MATIAPWKILNLSNVILTEAEKQHTIVEPTHPYMVLLNEVRIADVLPTIDDINTVAVRLVDYIKEHDCDAVLLSKDSIPPYVISALVNRCWEQQITPLFSKTDYVPIYKHTQAGEELAGFTYHWCGFVQIF